MRSRSVRRSPSIVGAPCIAQRSMISGPIGSTSSGPTKRTTPSTDVDSPGTVNRMSIAVALDSGAKGVNGNQNDASVRDSGAAYLFTR